MKVKPLSDRVLIKVQESETKTAGGIIIPQTAQEKTQTGVVVSVGPGVRDDSGKLIALEVKVGDKVMYDKYAGTQIKVDGAEHLIVKMADIFAVIEQGARLLGMKADLVKETGLFIRAQKNRPP